MERHYGVTPPHILQAAIERLTESGVPWWPNKKGEPEYFDKKRTLAVLQIEPLDDATCAQDKVPKYPRASRVFLDGKWRLVYDRHALADEIIPDSPVLEGQAQRREHADFLRQLADAIGEATPQAEFTCPSCGQTARSIPDANLLCGVCMLRMD
jgi:hypothetical protein